MPDGTKLATMNGPTTGKGRAPMPLGGRAVYTLSANGPNLFRYWLPDWQGGARACSTPNQTPCGDVAMAPYGEPYGGQDGWDFTGQWDQTEWDLYDFLYRELHPTQGRWLSPDPAGLAAVNHSNAQSWNRYAYVVNNPLAFTDPQGLGDVVPCGHGASKNGEAYTPAQATYWDLGQPYFTLDGVPIPASLLGLFLGSGESVTVITPNSGNPNDETPGPQDIVILGSANSDNFDLLGTLGQFFRGRPSGQSFPACVGRNMSLTFTGSPNSPIATTITSGVTALSGVLLGGPTFGGATLASRLAIAAKILMSPLPEGEAAEAALFSEAFAAADAAPPIALGVGAIGLAPLIGSAANCTSVGVTP